MHLSDDRLQESGRCHTRRHQPGSRRDCGISSERTGIQVVMGCGWYRDCYYPAAAEIERRSVDSLADELVAEIEKRCRQESGVRPGIIGEIGTEKYWMSPTEERVHRAAARAAATYRPSA